MAALAVDAAASGPGAGWVSYTCVCVYVYRLARWCKNVMAFHQDFLFQILSPRGLWPEGSEGEE